MEVQFLVAKAQCMTLASTSLEDLVFHAQSLRIEFDSRWDVLRRYDHMVERLDGEGSHPLVMHSDQTSRYNTAGTTVQAGKHVDAGIVL